MRLHLMIEGQEDVGWQDWTALATAAEQAGLAGLFRSDHYQSVAGRTERASLDAWTTLAGLAGITDRLRLGTLVSPATFRHPSLLAKSAVTVDHISGGRVTLGMGAGWHELEHTTYGFPFPGPDERLSRLEEQVEIVVRQQIDVAFDFEGEHYRLQDCRALPKPVQDPRVPLIVGGHAGPRSLALAANWADEYNSPFVDPAEAAARRERLDAACSRAGRPPLAFSVMTGCLLGRDTEDLHDRAARLMEWSGAEGAVQDWLGRLRAEWIVGTPEQAAERIAAYGEAGVDAIMLQHQLHEDTDMVALMGELV